MPARRRKRTIGKKKSYRSLIYLLLILIFTCAYFFIRQTKHYFGNNKLSIVFQKDSGDVVVAVLDPQNGELTSINIPGNTQVEVAKRLGVWKLKSVWKLGENEKLGGSLLASTLNKNFNFPIYTWSNARGLKLISANPLESLKAALSPIDSNLNLSDRLSIAIFSFGIKNASRVEVDLADTTVIKKTKLTDGVEGYVLTGIPSQKTLSYFAEPDMSEKSLRVEIISPDSTSTIAEEVGKTVEVLGAKIASIENEDNLDFDCEVSGKDEMMVNKVSSVFSCKNKVYDKQSAFDLTIKLGNNFIERF